MDFSILVENVRRGLFIGFKKLFSSCVSSVDLYIDICDVSYCCRDAVNDLALHFLAKMKIMVVKDIEREDIEFVCKVCMYFVSFS